MISGIFTSLAFFAFITTCIWAALGRNRKRFEEAAALPLHEDDQPTLATNTAPASEQTQDCGCGGCRV